jgi:hypothetical protein
VTRFTYLEGIENGVEDRGDHAAESHFENDCVRVAVGDVRVLGDADSNSRLSPVGQARRLKDRIPMKAHAPFVHHDRMATKVDATSEGGAGSGAAHVDDHAHELGGVVFVRQRC